MKAIKGFKKGSKEEKAYDSYLGNKETVYVAYEQKDGSFLRTKNGRATSVARSKSELSDAYIIKKISDFK